MKVITISAMSVIEEEKMSQPLKIMDGRGLFEEKKTYSEGFLIKRRFIESL
jgi:hypothetical protein